MGLRVEAQQPVLLQRKEYSGLRGWLQYEPEAIPAADYYA
jgi:hypothetical protein